jgi:hypothetical protein
MQGACRLVLSPPREKKPIHFNGLNNFSRWDAGGPKKMRSRQRGRAHSTVC